MLQLRRGTVRCSQQSLPVLGALQCKVPDSFFLLLYEPKVEGDQKQREVYEASYSQKLRGHRKSEERNGNTDVIPRKIPTRPRREKKRAGEKLKNILQVDFSQ